MATIAQKLGISPAQPTTNDAAGLQQNNTVYRNRLRTAKALSNVMAGTGRMRIACVGDSTTGNYQGLKTNAWPAQLAAMLTKMGVPSISTSFFGMAHVSATKAGYVTYNPQVTIGAGWANSIALRSIGGPVFTNSTDTSVLSWAMPGQVDTIELYYVSGNVGSFTWDVDGGSASTLSTTASQACVKTTVTVTKGSHTLNITRVSGTCHFIGALAYDSTTPAVDVINLGVNSATTGGLSGALNPWDIQGATATLAPDLLIFNGGINDDTQSVAPATVKANITAMVSAAGAYADVWVCRPNPIGSSVQDLSAIYPAVASEQSATFTDLVGLLKSYTTANALGLMLDAAHPNTLGYSVISRFHAKNLIGV